MSCWVRMDLQRFGLRMARLRKVGMRLSPLMIVHICAGSVGLLSGAVALCVRKGGRGHALAGRVFVGAMLTLAATGASIAFQRAEPNNVVAGALTFYMISTAWMTARRRDGKTTVFDFVALPAALAVGAVCLTYGFEAAHSPTGAKNGVPAGMDFFLGSVVLVAAAGDIRMLAQGGIFGGQRIARHLWRMCFGLFIASGSFFLGQQQVFPAFVRKSNVLIVPALLPLALLIFWLIRVRFKNPYLGNAATHEGKVRSLPI